MDYDNNCQLAYSYLTVDGRRDFQVTSMTAAVASAAVGQSVTVSYTVANKGYPYSSEILGYWFWSESENVTSQDPIVAWTGIPKFSTQTNTSSSTSTITVPMNASVGTHYLGFCVDRLNFVEETDETNNCRSIPVNVIASSSQSYAQIVATALDVVAGAPGDKVKLTIAVTNAGTLETLPYSVTIALSFPQAPASCLPSQSQPLTQFTGAPIPAGESRILDPVSFEVPRSFVQGRYWIFICAATTIRETNQPAQSRAIHPFFVTTAPMAYDLRPPGLVSPLTATAGGPLSIPIGVSNSGSGPVAQTTRTSILWSTDKVLSTDDREIGRNLATINEGFFASSFQTTTVTIPTDATVGDYYILVCADSTNFVPETDEDNCAAYPVRIVSPDTPLDRWWIGNLQVSPERARTAETITLSFALKNGVNVSKSPDNSTNFIGALFTIRWSADPNILSTDPEIAEVWVNGFQAGVSRSFSVRLQVPSNLTAGTYYLGVCPYAAAELSQCSVIPVNVVSERVIDLRISDVLLSAASVTSGDAVWVSFSASNDGNTAARRVLHGIRWSFDATVTEDALALRQILSGGPDPGSSINLGPFKVQIPTSVETGTYYIAVCADDDNSVAESDDANNCSVAPLAVTNPGGPQTMRLSVNSFKAGSVSTLGAGSSVSTGYAMIVSQTGPLPYGAAVFGMRQGGIIVSEVGVPASALTRTARTFVEFRHGVPIEGGLIDINTGVAIANPGSSDPRLGLTLRGLDGRILASGTATLSATRHIAYFIDQLSTLFSGFTLPGDFVAQGRGTLEISSDSPISITALRLTLNQRGESLMTVLPVADLSAAPSADVTFPHFADGAGYVSSIILMNTSSAPQSGAVRFWNNEGAAATLAGPNGNSFRYNIPGNGAIVLETSGGGDLQSGSVEVLSDNNTNAVVGALIFRHTEHGILVTETAVPNATPSKEMWVYVDLSRGHNTGIAISNPNASSVSLWLQPSGPSDTGLDTYRATIPPKGHLSAFVTELFPRLPLDFKGQMRIVVVEEPLPIDAITLRSLNNGRGEFLLTTLPVANAERAVTGPVIFPHIADGAGYTTEIILINTDRYTRASSVIGLFPDQQQLFSVP